MHISKTVFRIFDFDLKPAQIFENVPLPVLTKSYSGNDEIVYLYRRNTQVSLERIDGLTDGQFYL